MPRGITDTSQEVYGLHMLILWVCVVIGVGVFGVMVYSLVMHRKSRGVEPASFKESTQAEVAWTIIPAIILVALAYPSAETLVRMDDARNPDLTVKVTGYQWKWHYDYIDEGVDFFSSLDRRSNEARQLGATLRPQDVENYLLEVDQPLVVPVDAKVRILMTAVDVLHSWWVPEFAVKKDAIPGFINETWFQPREVGTFRGQCAELCGRDHGFMPVVVQVKSREDYDAWLSERQSEASVAAAN
jgi:cytochrome c oxidase subunit 2